MCVYHRVALQVDAGNATAASDPTAASNAAATQYQPEVERMVRSAAALGVPEDRARRAAVATQLLSASLAGDIVTSAAVESGVTVSEILSAARAVGRHNPSFRSEPARSVPLPVVQIPSNLRQPSEVAPPPLAVQPTIPSVPSQAVQASVVPPELQSAAPVAGPRAASMPGRGLGVGLPSRRASVLRSQAAPVPAEHRAPAVLQTSQPLAGEEMHPMLGRNIGCGAACRWPVTRICLLKTNALSFSFPLYAMLWCEFVVK